jgi:ABC-type nitrate/sulfonate/bicarbonate transport system permease component
MFAVLVLITLLGLVFYKFAEWLERLFLRPRLQSQGMLKYEKLDS